MCRCEKIKRNMIYSLWNKHGAIIVLTSFWRVCWCHVNRHHSVGQWGVEERRGPPVSVASSPPHSATDQLWALMQQCLVIWYIRQLLSTTISCVILNSEKQVSIDMDRNFASSNWMNWICYSFVPLIKRHRDCGSAYGKFKNVTLQALNNRVHLSVLTSFTDTISPSWSVWTAAHYCRMWTPLWIDAAVLKRKRELRSSLFVIRSNRAPGKGMTSSCLFISVWLTTPWTPISCSGCIWWYGCWGRGSTVPSKNEGVCLSL